MVKSLYKHKKKKSLTNLGPTENDSFPQVLKHERESRCSVSHGVRPVEDNKSVEVLVVLEHIPANPPPVLHGKVAGILKG